MPDPGAATCLPCVEGSYCLKRSAEPLACPPGSVSPSAGQSNCTVCAKGSYQRASNQTSCEACPPGSWCDWGAAAPTACPAGTYRSAPGASSEEQCMECPEGSACPQGSEAPSMCSPGSFAVAGASECTPCEAGTRVGTLETRHENRHSTQLREARRLAQAPGQGDAAQR